MRQLLTHTIRTKKTRVTQSDINRQAGQILSFYGSKGGVGKSVLAMNTAVLLSQEKTPRSFSWIWICSLEMWACL